MDETRTGTEGAPAGTHTADGAAEHVLVLVVEVGDHRVGLRMERVVELQRMVAPTPVAGASAAIEGVIDVRGTVVPMVDLRTRLGLPRRPPRTSDHLVLVDVSGHRVALRVDRVLDLVPTSLDVIAAAAGFEPPAHLGGVARLVDGLLLIQDVGAFLSDDEAAALDTALATADSPAGAVHD